MLTDVNCYPILWETTVHYINSNLIPRRRHRNYDSQYKSLSQWRTYQVHIATSIMLQIYPQSFWVCLIIFTKKYSVLSSTQYHRTHKIQMWKLIFHNRWFLKEIGLAFFLLRNPKYRVPTFCVKYCNGNHSQIFKKWKNLTIENLIFLFLHDWLESKRFAIFNRHNWKLN